MNKRIKELAEQAGFYTKVDTPEYFDLLQRLADLIIEECALAAAVGWLKFCDEGVSATFPVGEYIKEHFEAE